MPRALPAPSLWARLRRVAPPRPLAALLLVVAVVGMGWALTVAPWQSPDETVQFAYAQTLATTGTLPAPAGVKPQVSSAQELADGTVGASRGAFYPAASPPNWDAAQWLAYQHEVATTHPSNTDGGGNNPAAPDPPFYFGYADVAYLLDGGGTAFGQLYGIRIAGVVLLLISTIAAWLLAGETLGRRRLPQLACAAVVGLLPMVTFMSTNVNPDAMMITLWTLALWLGVRVIRRGAVTVDVAALCAINAAAILTKATSYALVVPVVYAIAIGWWRRPRNERPAALRRVSLAALWLVLPVVGWLALARALHRSAINQIAGSSATAFNVKQFLSYVWQYYLPRLPFLQPFRTVSGSALPADQVWVHQVIGTFGWLDISLPGWCYNVGSVILGLIAIAAIWCVCRLRDRNALWLLAFFFIALIALLGLLHITEYRSVIAGDGAVLQGRYLLPVVGLFGLAVGLIVSRIPMRIRGVSTGVVVSGMLAVQFIALTTILTGYYL